MKIIKIGTWDGNGMPTGWHFDCGSGGAALHIEKGHVIHGACLELDLHGAGVVSVNGVELVEWTDARREAKAKGENL